MPRLLRFAGEKSCFLSHNDLHQLAASYSLLHFPSGAIYTMIPKNACSTFRFSLAVANGCISGPQQIHWIHGNENTFAASVFELQSTRFSFVILRCPFKRLASCFSDKFVSMTGVAWHYYDLIERREELHELTFRKFVHSLLNSKIFYGNVHWRPQTDFLVYQDYDAVFQFEDFTFLKKQLQQQIGLEVLDSRPYLRHSCEKFAALTHDNFADMPIKELFKLKMEMQIPDPSFYYDPELLNIVCNLYQSDLTMYKQNFGPSRLLFQI